MIVFDRPSEDAGAAIVHQSMTMADQSIIEASFRTEPAASAFRAYQNASEKRRL
jgi:hypothetical protein